MVGRYTLLKKAKVYRNLSLQWVPVDCVHRESNFIWQFSRLEVSSGFTDQETGETWHDSSIRIGFPSGVVYLTNYFFVAVAQFTISSCEV